MTSMIATCSVEKGSIDESISTCRFAQRVALIKNDAMLNEELDPKLVRNNTFSLIFLEGERYLGSSNVRHALYVRKVMSTPCVNLS